MPVFSRLVPPLASAYGLQAVCAAIFVPLKDEKFYDLTGALTFLSTTFISLYYPSLKAKFWDKTISSLPSLLTFAPRQLLATAALTIWSVRLGSFLAQRALKAGGDSRFDEVKHNPGRFTFFWMAQATWVFLVGLPVYLCNTVPAAIHPPLGLRDFAALGVFSASLVFEIIADRQKSRWRKQKDAKQHDEKFITSGLWSISRHPNYIGEVGIWTGIWALAATSLQTVHYPRGTVLLAAAASPVFTYYLLRYLSGVPPLERAGRKRFGDDPKWKAYTETVPVFWPWGSVN